MKYEVYVVGSAQSVTWGVILLVPQSLYRLTFRLVFSLEEFYIFLNKPTNETLRHFDIVITTRFSTVDWTSTKLNF